MDQHIRSIVLFLDQIHFFLTDKSSILNRLLNVHLKTQLLNTSLNNNWSWIGHNSISELDGIPSEKNINVFYS